MCSKCACAVYCACYCICCIVCEPSIRLCAHFMSTCTDDQVMTDIIFNMCAMYGCTFIVYRWRLCVCKFRCMWYVCYSYGVQNGFVIYCVHKLV